MTRMLRLTSPGADNLEPPERKSQAAVIAGARYGRLVAVGPTGGRSRDKRAMWLFRCACGKETCTTAKNVKSGNKQSCGCLKLDWPKEHYKASRAEKNCPVCNEKFTVKLSHANKTTYCSKTCMAAAYKTRLVGPANPNYRNADYRATRAKHSALARQRRASVVGTAEPEEIEDLWVKQNGACALCKDGLHQGQVNLDHVIPLAKGGSGFIGNLQLLCETCNKRKNSRLPIDFRVRGIGNTTEEKEQTALFKWIVWSTGKYPDLRFIFHPPNGGFRFKSTAARMKALGAKPGVPDILWPMARGGAIGLAIEMKVPGNKPTKLQQEWLDGLTQQGWQCHVCYSATEAIEVLREYMGAPATVLSKAWRIQTA